MHNIVRKVFAKLGILYCKQKWHYDIILNFLVEQQSNDSLFWFPKTGDYRHLKIPWTFVWLIFSEHINSSFLNFLKIPTFLDFLDFWSDAYITKGSPKMWDSYVSIRAFIQFILDCEIYLSYKYSMICQFIAMHCIVLKEYSLVN